MFREIVKNEKRVYENHFAMIIKCKTKIIKKNRIVLTKFYKYDIIKSLF